MVSRYKIRRLAAVLILILSLMFAVLANQPKESNHAQTEPKKTNNSGILALDVLGEIDVKGRAPKTGYSRDQFGSDWKTVNGCSMRNIILNRDLNESILDDDCNVVSGVLYDPYTAKEIIFHKGSSTSSLIQIDHVVALSDAWQKGAQQMSFQSRVNLANDPLELIAVDGAANLQKSDGDAATWLPKNKSFRCEYIARQIAVKKKYSLWVTAAEKNAMISILSTCPKQMLPSP